MNPITITPLAGLTIAQVDGRIIAATTDALELAEGGYPPVVYFPPDHGDEAAHRPAARRTHCPFKGDARYLDVAGHPAAAWVYFDPIAAVAPIAGHLAYDTAHFEVSRRPLPALPPAAQRVLDFWFTETPASRQFNADAAFDAQIADRFGAMVGDAQAGTLDDWAQSPAGALALVILLDQFTRNIHRGTAAAFASDGKAQALSQEITANGFDLALPPDQRAFAYMPLMHAEDLALQNLSVALFSQRLPGSNNVRFALSHRADIHRYGRFPYRDEALGRAG